MGFAGGLKSPNNHPMGSKGITPIATYPTFADNYPEGGGAVVRAPIERILRDINPQDLALF
jgi:hypothetical protein